MTRITAVLLLLLSILLPSIVIHAGHNEDIYLTKVIGNYIVSVSADAPFVDDETPIRIRFDVYDSSTSEPIQFTDLDIHFELEGGTTHSARLAGTYPVVTPVLFPKIGNYTLDATFYNDEKKLVSLRENIWVRPTPAVRLVSQKNLFLPTYLKIVVPLLILSLFIYFLRRRPLKANK